MPEITDHIFAIFADFWDPKKRVFFGYLGLSFLIGFLWLVFVKRQDLRAAWAKICDPSVFWSASSKADYQIFVINRIFSFFISPLLITQLAIATALFYALHRQDWIAAGVFETASGPLVIGLFTATMFVIDDFTKYLVHRWMHHWPILWAIHKTHHSAETLTPITVYRVHPLEGVLYGLRSAVAQGVTLSGFYFLFGDLVDLYTVLGANVLVFIFHVTGSNLRHSHIHIAYWPWLERIVISPAQHQLHHSTAQVHFDKNFGAALALWDWLFGSLHLSEQEQELRFGLDPQDSHASDLVDIYMRPFVDIWRVITGRLRNYQRKISGFITQQR